MAIANMVMEDLESRIFNAENNVLIWRRFVDDTFVVLPRNDLPSFFTYINSLESSISFTMEKEMDDHLPFLDVLVKKETNHTFSTSVYRKPTCTNRYMQFDSHNPMAHKRAVVRTLVDRAEKLCSNKNTFTNEINFIKATLSQNGYPQSVLQVWNRKKRSKESKRCKVVIPYIQGISERISRTLASHDVQVAHRSVRKLRSIFKSPKDPTSPSTQCGVIYKIDCQDCDKVYVGQTKNSLGTRVNQHRAALRLLQPEKSALAEHAIMCHHQIDWSNPKVLSRETRWRHRLFLETWHTLQMEDRSLNRCEGNLASVYRTLLSRSSRPPQE